MDQWHIRIVLDRKNSVTITGYGPDPTYPMRVETQSAGPLGRVLLEEIRAEVIYPPQDMKWALQSENDLYGWHAAAGSVIDRRREPWQVDHNLP
ncbi:MAG: hypothetical protein APR53_05275 [Methanoculleus sp. SDB]|nr:MAG: hypothetical protein APR53_05275 [Methanoculleus sp. SDB]